MAPDATSVDLLYITDVYADDVYAFSYPQGKLEGKLTGFYEPTGLCVDKAGNIWVPNLAASNLVEYAHGGKQVIATLKDYKEEPDGCAVDATTGDLAVANYLSLRSDANGNVAVFQHARGKAKFYTDPVSFFGAFCGYDHAGNLFVDALSSPSAGFRFAELAKGSSSLKNISLTGGAIHYPGGVQWDGKYIAVGDQNYDNSGKSAIFHITGSNGKIIGTTKFDDTGRVGHWWIDGQTVIAPNITDGVVHFYNYPAGGSATKTIRHFDVPSGAVVSVAR
jgi:hypothetical protein